MEWCENIFGHLASALLVLITVALLCGPASAEGIRWFLRGGGDVVEDTHQMAEGDSADAYWESTVTDTADPYLVLRPVVADADVNRYLYIAVGLEFGGSLQVFMSDEVDGAFIERDSFRVASLPAGLEPQVLQIDMEGFPAWSGTARRFRIDLENVPRGSVARLFGVGVSVEAVANSDIGPVRSERAASPARLLQDRMAGWHTTMISTEERRGQSSLMTYHIDQPDTVHAYALAQLVAGVEQDGRTLWSDAARVESVEDFPGGVHAVFHLGTVEVSTEWLPVMVGRGSGEWDGAALFTVRTDPAVPVRLRCGGGRRYMTFDQAWMSDPRVGRAVDHAEVAGGLGLLTCDEHPLTVAVRAEGEMAAAPGDDGGKRLDIALPEGGGRVLLAYAEDRERAEVTARETDMTAARDEVAAYYNELLANRIKTPEPDMDAAFRSALYNLEYNYVEPYGWNECIDHWHALWHMHHTAGVEWIGQEERSRKCNEVHAENLIGNGAVPQFWPGGQTRRDFGGSNQFWGWQVWHYWRFTGDLDSMRRIAEPFDRVLAQTYEEYDRNNNLLLGWGLQIGNQEDYIATPMDGTTPSIDGINMMETRAEIARALGDAESANLWTARAAHARGLLREKLWLDDLARFAFYRDAVGQARLDSQYHTFIYPLLRGIVDPLDGYPAMRHLRDRLMGAGGQVYCSNNFPNHVGGTWGMQAGAAQQPWAAWGFARAGMFDETWRPLLAVSRWVMDENHRGAWPEIATEPAAAYFTPPAGLFIAAVCEALFGLHVNKPEGYVEVAPSFPEHWPEARMDVARFSVDYARDGNTLRYTVRSDDELARRLRWALPVCAVTRFEVNGQPADFELLPGIGHVILAADIPAAKETQFTVELAPADIRVDAPGSVAEGGTLHVEVDGARIESVEDRAGVLASNRRTGMSSMEFTLRGSLVTPYLGYGRLGQLNFARRTFFLACETPGGVRFWAPVDVAVLPRYELAPTGEVEMTDAGVRVSLLVRNNTDRDISELDALLTLPAGDFPVEVRVPARAEMVVQAEVPANLAALLSAGDNPARLALPGLATSLSTEAPIDAPFHQAPMSDYAANRMAPIALPEEAFVPDTEWRALRTWEAFGHPPWNASRPPLEALEGQDTLAVDGVPGLAFDLPERSFVPVARQYGRGSFTLDLEGQTYRKLYLLVIPFLDNHDMFSEVADITVRDMHNVAASATLRFPGDVDWWVDPGIVGIFATLHGEREDRRGLLPRLGEDDSDWEEGKPPAESPIISISTTLPGFPQPAFWARSRAIATGTAVMNVIELTLGQPTELDSITFQARGARPAFGIVAVTGETQGDMEPLRDTRWAPPRRFWAPKALWTFATPGDTLGWKLEGDAFSVAAHPHLFNTPTLNSLVARGESATDRAVSPVFEPGEWATRLLVDLQGGKPRAGEALGLRVVDARTGETLREMDAPGTHYLREHEVSLEGLQGRRLRVELVDENTAASNAWVGVKRIRLAGPPK